MSKKKYEESNHEDHEGFREGVVKYSYSFAYKGSLKNIKSDDLVEYTVGSIIHIYDRPNIIRRIETSWLYGTKNFLIFLEDKNYSVVKV
jgi:hypothetical protein